MSGATGMNCCVCNGSCTHGGWHTYCVEHSRLLSTVPTWVWPGSPAISDASLAFALAPVVEALARLVALLERLTELTLSARGVAAVEVQTAVETAVLQERTACAELVEGQDREAKRHEIAAAIQARGGAGRP